MASRILKRSMMMKSTVESLRIAAASRHYASVTVGTDLVSAAADVRLQKARTWDEGVSSKFSTTPLKELFKDKKVVIFGLPVAFGGEKNLKHSLVDMFVIITGFVFEIRTSTWSLEN
ncbi:Peroxiredoxin-2F, mitochondrial [Vitis vinifera]|uniref:Peroxiredoxin-2F, mitochondrial n=1 Tax=Vitis vinifera TaxID=29760 RepID=A0A438KKC3_VITVI|nr:Peroxiredoxin-2F, mitochondrial [Vitis vinifera]